MSSSVSGEDLLPSFPTTFIAEDSCGSSLEENNL